MVCLIIDALIRFMFIIQNSFLLLMWQSRCCAAVCPGCWFRKAKPQPLSFGKKCEKMLQLKISLDLLEAFSHTLVTRDDEEDDLVIHPSIESDG